MPVGIKIIPNFSKFCVVFTWQWNYRLNPVWKPANRPPPLHMTGCLPLTNNHVYKVLYRLKFLLLQWIDGCEVIVGRKSGLPVLRKSESGSVIRCIHLESMLKGNLHVFIWIHRNSGESPSLSKTKNFGKLRYVFEPDGAHAVGINHPFRRNRIQLPVGVEDIEFFMSKVTGLSVISMGSGIHTFWKIPLL